jgi:hypothetical protein
MTTFRSDLSSQTALQHKAGNSCGDPGHRMKLRLDFLVRIIRPFGQALQVKLLTIQCDLSGNP